MELGVFTPPIKENPDVLPRQGKPPHQSQDEFDEETVSAEA
jgi:hypothetical protein